MTVQIAFDLEINDQDSSTNGAFRTSAKWGEM
jgi:hypothetical protein